MNYDQPRQIAEGENAGKWHYTSANRRAGTHPIGYCAEHAPHDTEAEARECYGQYLRDSVRLGEPHTWSWGTCDYGRKENGGEGETPCSNPANNGAHSGPWHMALLCDEHFNRDDAVKALGLDGPAGDSWHS